MSLYGIHVVICTEFLFTKYISHFIMKIICSYEAGTISIGVFGWYSAGCFRLLLAASATQGTVGRTSKSRLPLVFYTSGS